MKIKRLAWILRPEAGALVFFVFLLYLAVTLHTTIVSSAEVDGYIGNASAVMKSETPHDEFRPYLYILLVAAVGKVTGGPFSGGRLISVLAASLFVYFTYLIGISLFKKRGVATTAALLVALNPYVLTSGMLVATDALAAMFICGTLYLCLRMTESGRERYAALMGLFFALAMSTRYACAFAFPVIGISLLLAKAPFKRRLVLTAIFGLCFLLAFMPALIWNYIVWENPFYSKNWINFAYKVYGPQYSTMNLDGLKSVILASPKEVWKSFINEVGVFTKTTFPQLCDGMFFVFCFGWGAYWSLIRANRKIWLVLIYFVSMAVGQCFFFFAQIRMLLPILPIACLFMARFLYPTKAVKVWQRGRVALRPEPLFVLGALVFLILSVTLPEVRAFKALHNYDEIELAKGLEKKVRDFEQVMATFPFMEYFVDYQAVQMPPFSGTPQQDIENIVKTMERRNINYLIVGKQWLGNRPRNLLSAYLSIEGLTIVERRDEAVLYERVREEKQLTSHPVDVNSQKLEPGLQRILYDTRDWIGKPLRKGVDKEINFNWNEPRTRPHPLPFSIVWKGYIEIQSPGEYHFFIASDDGCWLYIDGQPVVENPGMHDASVEKHGKIKMEKGFHEVLIKYFDTGFGASIRVSWASPNKSKSVLGGSNLFYAPPQ